MMRALTKQMILTYGTYSPGRFVKQICIMGFMLFCSVTILRAQQYDLLIKGGHLIDPKNNIDGVIDIGVKDGHIQRVAKDIPAAEGAKVVDATGLYVSPGFVDIHAHFYHGTNPHTEYSNGFNALNPDQFTFPTGVTTAVETGGAGWRNFVHFKEQVIDRVQTRIFALINIVGHGMSGIHEQNIEDMNPKMSALVARQYRNDIVGFKLAHYNGHDWTPVDLLLEAGRLADLPVMVDFGSANPPLSLETLFMEKFRPGDIYTHIYGGGSGGRQGVLDENGNVRPFLLDAQKRGVVYDVGHGGASFSYANAVPALAAGVKPNTISTDAHGRSVLSGMKGMTNVMSKFLNMGMTLNEVITASTWTPANVIKHPELGHLSEGALADITVFNVLEGKFGFAERTGINKMMGTQKIEVEMTVKDGRIVWDLNGISAPLWNASEN